MKSLFLFLIGPMSSFSFGQVQHYFQQEVNYTIDVRLDDINHFLNGVIEFEYVNHAPDQLHEIYVHLWPNAYEGKHTALAKQQYSEGDYDLTFAGDDMKGYIDSLDFSLNKQKITWEYLEEHRDICKVILPSPLKPGERVSIATPFRVKIPSGAISRLGHIDQSYQITQWYPKPAVYDKDGWHPMPYLDQGEFYAEYGSFDVSITLPENYVVGATGDLQTASEIAFLNQKAETTRNEIEATGVDRQKPKSVADAFPPSSKTFKTIRYTQSNVHDFAWFADKRYNVLKGEVVLPNSKRKVTSWAMYTPKNEHLWYKAIEYINDATYYYSKWNGDYPYNQVTAVDGTISAGGGMEYPNVTVIGNVSNAQELEIVIVHEVGHNWFYGQLGSNERVHGWMDEGINTMNEVRYMQTKYPNNTAISDMVLNGLFHLNDLDYHDISDISYRILAGMGEDQPIETHAAEFSSASYGIVMYGKAGLVFLYLKDYLGEALFDECMQAYYRQWEFKHPSPEDMRASFEKSSGKDLGWLFEDLINTTRHPDYKLKSVKLAKQGYLVTVKNKGQVNGPIEVNGMKGDSVVITKWIEPGAKKQSVLLESGSGEISHVVIDHGKDIPELNRQNNYSRTNAAGIFRKAEPVSVEFMTGDNEPGKTNIFWTPVIAGNTYDKAMIGVGLHNYGLPFSKFNYLFVPMYSTGRQMVSGITEVCVNYQPVNHIKLSRFGVSVKSFKHDSAFRGNTSYYFTASPFWLAKLGNRDQRALPYESILWIRGLYRKDQFGPTHFEHAGGFLQYDVNYKRTDHVFKLTLRNDYLTNVKTATEIGRVTASATYRFRYLRNKQQKWIEIRGFFGNQYLSNYASKGAKTSHFSRYQYSMSPGGMDGQQDLFTENYFFGRNDVSGIWSQQREENLGGFKTTSDFGTTGRWMTTANVWTNLPYVPRIFGVFADVGAFADQTTGYSTAINTGIGLRLGQVFGIYFPMWMSKELNDSFGNSKYAEKIRFTLHFNVIHNPLRISDYI